MYVSGKVKDADNVLINIGTGYYIEKVCQKIKPSSQFTQTNLLQDIVGAKDYFDRKVKYVTEQMEKIQVIGIEKSKIRDCRCKRNATT
jgi:prefoldin alpha subunit